nr:MAG TPA: hypothetical protein [Bacteriophage sp.]
MYCVSVYRTFVVRQELLPSQAPKRKEANKNM